jgi:hypothetical protein
MLFLVLDRAMTPRRLLVFWTDYYLEVSVAIALDM